MNDSDARLTAAAFGDDPGRWPLPSATAPEQLWLRAVVAGGQGRYGSATADLAALRRVGDASRWASLAHSTQGSFLRQLGGHELARNWDGRALVLARSDPEATVDALIGLAADAIGTRRIAACTALLNRAADALSAPALPPRSSLRWRWVSAELAMARGDGAEALHHAQLAVREAARQPSTRHRVKTTVVCAAALSCAGELEQARASADEALSLAGSLRLVPLQWAVASLLVGIGSGCRSRSEVAALRDRCADAVVRAGGRWYR